MSGALALIRKVEYLLLLQHELGHLQGTLETPAFHVLDEALDGLLDRTLQLALVELQGLLLDLVGRIGHIAFKGFLDPEHVTLAAALDEHLLEGTTPFLVVKAVNGENLLAVDGCQGEGGLDIIELVLELGLVKEHEDLGVTDDCLLDDRGGHDVLYIAQCLRAVL